MVEKNKEQERTIIYQKAKLEALQNELDGAISALNEKDLELSQNTRKDNFEAQSEKYNKQISSLTADLKKATNLNKKHEKHIKTLEAQLQQAETKIDRFERENKKYGQDTNVKDVRLNRVIEELERYKIKLKDAQEMETGKSKEMREEVDRVNEENRKLERQRNELMQVFKKQMKLIDILKKQKMHIEAAGMLKFTEDEFTKLLDV